MLVAALLVMEIVPATANAAPTVTATGDAGTPITLNPSAPTGIRQMAVTVRVAVPASDRSVFGGVLDGEGRRRPAGARDSGGLSGLASYHGNGAYTVVVKSYSSERRRLHRHGPRDTLPVRGQRRFGRHAAARQAADPQARLVRHQHVPARRDAEPGRDLVRDPYARNGVVQPDGSLGGTPKSAFVDTTSGLANFSFDKPGRYVIVARAERDGFFSPGARRPSSTRSRRSTSPASSSPTTRARATSCSAQIREHSARGKVTIYLAKGKKKGKFHKVGKAKISKKGRFTKRFTVRHAGTYRLRYIYRGNSTVAAGRVTERIKITRHFFF